MFEGCREAPQVQVGGQAERPRLPDHLRHLMYPDARADKVTQQCGPSFRKMRNGMAAYLFTIFMHDGRFICVSDYITKNTVEREGEVGELAMAGSLLRSPYCRRDR